MKIATMVYKINNGEVVNKVVDAFAVEGHESDLDEAIKEGWHESPSEAKDADISDLPPTRAELEEKAVELGIKFDGRTKDKSLAKKIQDALGEG